MTTIKSLPWWYVGNQSMLQGGSSPGLEFTKRQTSKCTYEKNIGQNCLERRKIMPSCFKKHFITVSEAVYLGKVL